MNVYPLSTSVLFLELSVASESDIMEQKRLVRSFSFTLSWTFFGGLEINHLALLYICWLTKANSFSSKKHIWVIAWIIKVRKEIKFTFSVYSCGPRGNTNTARYLTKSQNQPTILANHYIGLTPSHTHTIKSILKALTTLYLIKVSSHLSIRPPPLPPLSQHDSPPLSYPLILLSIFAPRGPRWWTAVLNPGPTLSEWQDQSSNLAKWHTNVADWLSGWLAGSWCCSGPVHSTGLSAGTRASTHIFFFAHVLKMKG